MMDNAADGSIASTMRHMNLFCRESVSDSGAVKGPKNALIAPQTIYFPDDFQGPALDVQKSLIDHVTKMFYQETGARISVKEKASPNRANKRIRFRCRNTKCQFRFQMNLDEGKAATSCEENHNLWFIPQGTGNFKHSFDDCFCTPHRPWVMQSENSALSSRTSRESQNAARMSAFQQPLRSGNPSSVSTLSSGNNSAFHQHQEPHQDSHPRRVSPTHSLESSPILAHAAWGQLPGIHSSPYAHMLELQRALPHDFLSTAMPYQQLSMSQIMQALGGTSSSGANAASFALPGTLQQNPLFQESFRHQHQQAMSQQSSGECTSREQQESTTLVTPTTETSSLESQDAESHSSSVARKRSRGSSLSQDSASMTNDSNSDAPPQARKRAKSFHESTAGKEQAIADLEVNALAALMGLQKDSTSLQ